MIRQVLLALLGIASPLTAQIPNLWEGEAMVGLAGQNDTQKLDRVQLSGVGLNIGFIAQPIFGKRNLSISDQISFFPAINYDKPVPFDPNPPPSTNPLIINTFWVRLGTSEPELEGQFVYFVGTGVAMTASSPRSGSRIQPMGGVGVRRWFGRQLGVELSLQCTLKQLGRTACQVPITTLWPFRAAKSG